MRARQWKSAAARRLISMGGGADVESAIQRIVERHCSGIPRVPMDLDALAARLGVVRLSRAPLTVAGELRHSSAGLEIVCDDSLTEGRLRFTIAHELGHAMMEKSGQGAPRQGRELERLCDRIAAEILLPRSIMDQELPRFPCLTDIERIARRFRASLSAVALRAGEMRRLASFEVSRAGVVWSGGVFRRFPTAARATLDRALAGERASDIVYLYDPDEAGAWRVEALPIRGSGSALAIFSRVARSDRPETRA